MARSAASYNRPKPRYAPQPTVLIICEDSKSGLNYLNDAAMHFRVHVQVEVSHCGKTDPLGIVSDALSRQGKFDSVYCVIDRDQHPNFEEALALANSAERITVIASYPCFEFWLLLHFGYSRKPFKAIGTKSSGDLLLKDLRTLPGFEDYEKGKEINIFSLLEDKLEAARKTSIKVLSEAESLGEMNPSTKLHKLIDKFEELSAPQKNTKV